MVLAHNGNLSNTDELRSSLEEQGAIFQTTIDSEIIAYLIARYRAQTKTVEEAVAMTMQRLQGAYSLLVMSRGQAELLSAIRSASGRSASAVWAMRLSLLRSPAALDAVGATFVRDVEPGEIVIADRTGLRSLKTQCKGLNRKCIFEYIYFARPDSTIDGISVHAARLKAGQLLGCSASGRG